MLQAADERTNKAIQEKKVKRPPARTGRLALVRWGHSLTGFSRADQSTSPSMLLEQAVEARGDRAGEDLLKAKLAIADLNRKVSQSSTRANWRVHGVVLWVP